MPTFESFDGVSLWYDDRGSGVPVLLLHGVMSDSEFNWVRPGIVDALLAAGRRVVLLDARGHGRSEKPHEVSAYADDAMARDAQALLDELGIDVVDVVGYSMGSYTTSRLALRDKRLRKLVLGGAGVYTFRRNPEVAERFAQALEADELPSDADAAARAWREYADEVGVDRIAMACFFRTPRRATDDELASLGSRTLILTGDADEVAGSATEVAAAIPGARYVSVPGTHFANDDRALDHPSFTQELLAFLSSTSA